MCNVPTIQIKKKIKIFLDDERNINDVTWMSLADPDDYKIARNFKEFKALVDEAIEDYYIPEVSFDHDLADFHDSVEPDLERFAIKSNGKFEFTGFSCLKYLIDKILENGMHDKTFNIFHTFHTQNPVMKSRMEQEWDFFTSFDFEE